MRRSGFTLVEVLVAVTIIAIAAAGTTSLYATHLKGERFTEERRLALQAAVQKIDEMRTYLANMDPTSGDVVGEGSSPIKGGLNSLWNQYKPVTAGITNANPPTTVAAAFKVSGLTTNSAYPNLCDYVGTVSFIVDENPNEAGYGVDYSVPSGANVIGVDISGDGNYSENCPPPFPLDLDGDGVTPTSDNLSGYLNGTISEPLFYMLPVVVTVHWQGVYGNQRLDFFTILSPDKEN